MTLAGFNKVLFGFVSCCCLAQAAPQGNEALGQQELLGEITSGVASNADVDYLALIEVDKPKSESEPFRFFQSGSLSSEVLKEQRHYKVYLPASYLSKPDYNYPVLYVLDGERQFLNIGSSIEALSTGSNPLLPELIVVAVSSKGAKQHRENMTPSLSLGKGGNGDKFLEFLLSELKPAINQQYRSSGYDIISGQGMAGLFVVNSLFTRADSFDAFIAISPLMWWEDYRLVDKAEDYLKKLTAPAKKLYVFQANEPRLGVYGLVEQLDRHRSLGVDWQFKAFADENRESLLMPAIRYALKDLFAGWYISYKDLADMPNYHAVKTHFEQYQARFKLQQAIPAYTFKALLHQSPRAQLEQNAAALYLQVTQHFPLSLIDLRNHLSALAIKEKEYDKAAELLQASYKDFAYDFTVQRSMAKWYKAKRQWDEAEEAAQRALQLATEQQQRDWVLRELEAELLAIQDKQ